MGRALNYDIPGADWRITEEDVREKGWDAIFGSDLPRPLRFVIEIGFGNGDFLIDRARRDPRAAHVGVEYSRKRVLKTARRLARTELSNVRLLHATGEVVVQELLPEARLGRQAPAIDGRLLINDGTAAAGSLVEVEITDAHPYDLVGRIVRVLQPGVVSNVRLPVVG